MQRDFDIIVLGSGPGGYVAAIRASQLGMKVAIVEKEALGGICLNWGCIPTKALLKSAEALETVKESTKYGLQCIGITADFPEIIRQSRNVAQEMQSGVNFLMKKNQINVIYGYGKVKPGKRIEVTDNEGHIKVYTASHIIIATGATPKSLLNLPFDGKYVIDYRKAMQLELQPKHIAIIGAGAIGMEFAYFFHTLGTDVSIIEFAPRILPNEDEDVSQFIQKKYTKEGMQIYTSSRVLAYKVEDNNCMLIVSTPQGEKEIIVEKILSATGVTSNTSNIGLEYVGIATVDGKIKVNDYYATNIEGYYAIGDVIPGPALAHVASAEAITCVEAIAGLMPTPIRYDNIPGCTYCNPQVASVGMTEAQARTNGIDIAVGKFPFTASGKAKASRHTDGFVKMIFDKKYGEILGAHLVGYGVTEMIAEVVVARQLESTATQLLKSVHPHPTLSEAIMEATAVALGEGIHL
jgi:dihydrolipoamide dehydrogenase